MAEPKSLLDSDQAKLVGGALSVLVVFAWTAALPEGSPWRPSNEVAQAVTVIMVAVVDRALAGRKPPRAEPPQQEQQR